MKEERNKKKIFKVVFRRLEVIPVFVRADNEDEAEKLAYDCAFDNNGNGNLREYFQDNYHEYEVESIDDENFDDDYMLQDDMENMLKRFDDWKKEEEKEKDKK